METQTTEASLAVRGPLTEEEQQRVDAWPEGTVTEEVAGELRRRRRGNS
ncbi:hypothetical protein [Geodermatophilus ruber]|uniref:Uncharacterized protein n=1 Tax=Geodermatophilus ruber TaxID=504800 RepID=A0A1I4BPT2_9ACTN|nr:hypothetical protein [Geodermatophilus ruber]SFK70420.1 hypothetical protein SAMN04488085_103133 [Geodermatophilus ruber]